MPILLNINYDDSEGVKTVDLTAEQAQDMTPVFKAFSPAMMFSISRNFRDGGRPIKWPKSQRAIDESGQTLRDEGFLQNSINPKISKNSLKVGTNLVKARALQLGIKQNNKTANVKKHNRTITQAFGKPIAAKTVSFGPYTRKVNLNLEARPYLVIQDEDREELKRLMRKRLVT